MYSREKRLKAVELYIRYDRCPSQVIRELGYPSCRNQLRKWYLAYLEEQESGIIKNSYATRKSRYSDSQKQEAVDNYFYTGQSLARTCRVLGYPSKAALANWIDELAPGRRKQNAKLECTYQEKKEAVISLVTRSSTAEKTAQQHGANRDALYRWKKEILGQEGHGMERKRREHVEDSDQLKQEAEVLRQEVQRLELEVDILRGTAELIKKDPCADPTLLSNAEKAMLVDVLKGKHRLNKILEILNLPRSSYYYQLAAQNKPDKYRETRSRVIELFTSNRACYGYRRIHALLGKEGTVISEKVVRRLMSTSGLQLVSRKKRKYKSYAGEITPAPENIVQRNFQADRPNKKWLTDITEFGLPAGKVYLSPIIDCFDGLAVSWSIGTSPNSELANSMLIAAIETLDPKDRPLIHSDRGSHYRRPRWIQLMENRQLTRSMSKKGCSPDNAACEGFFGRLKTEFFYGRNWQDITVEVFIDELDGYIHWYNEERIKQSLGWMSPLEYRQRLALSA